MNLSLAQKEIYDLPLTLVMIAHANFLKTMRVLLHDSWRFRKNLGLNFCMKSLPLHVLIKRVYYNKRKPNF